MSDKKELKILLTPMAFLDPSQREAITDESSLLHEEAKKRLEEWKGFFKTEDKDEKILVSLKMEDLIFELFLKLEAPKSPLGKAAHDKFIQDVSAELAKTVGTEDLPSLSDEDLAKVKPFVAEDSKFDELFLPFFYKKDSEEAAAEATIELSAKIIMADVAFVSTLGKVFKVI